MHVITQEQGGTYACLPFHWQGYCYTACLAHVPEVTLGKQAGLTEDGRQAM